MNKNQPNKLQVLLIIFSISFIMSCSQNGVNPRYTQNDSASTETQDDTTKDGTDGLVQDDTSEFTEGNITDDSVSMDEGGLQDDTTGMEDELKLIEKEAREKFENEDIHFDYDSTRVDEIAQSLLNEKAEWMANHPFLNITIEGHCDVRGTTEYNLSLGEKRAAAAKQYLIDLGISDTRISTISFGEEKPVDMGENEAAWARNRRAHFIIK